MLFPPHLHTDLTPTLHTSHPQMGNSIPSLKLTYFDIEGVAEQIRLTLKVQGILFEDERISFDEWPQMKAKTRFGQLPVLSIDGGPPVSQSGAILRLCARLKSNYNLYPIEPEKVSMRTECLKPSITPQP